MLNRPKLFENYAITWFDILLKYCTKENKPNGGKGFHYFLRDVIVQIIKWSKMNDGNVKKKYE